MLEGPKIQEIQKKPKPDFKLGEEVIAVFPDRCVLPLVVGQTYTITNMKYHHIWEWEYEIENYPDQIFDCVEFSSFFRHKYQIFPDPNKDENIQKFIKLTPYIEIKLSDRYMFGRNLYFDEEKFNKDETMLDLKNDPIYPIILKKLKQLLNIIYYSPEYADKEVEDLWDYL